MIESEGASIKKVTLYKFNNVICIHCINKEDTASRWDWMEISPAS